MTTYLKYSGDNLTVDNFNTARMELTNFMIRAAASVTKRFDFTYELVSDEEMSKVDLAAAFRGSFMTGAPFPIRLSRSATSVYLDTAAEDAYAFWHMVWHLDLRIGTSIEDELVLARGHVSILEDGGWPPLSVAMLSALLIGGVYLRELTHRSPMNDLRFVSDVLAFGLADALDLEEQRQGIAAA